MHFRNLVGAMLLCVFPCALSVPSSASTPGACPDPQPKCTGNPEYCGAASGLCTWTISQDPAAGTAVVTAADTNGYSAVAKSPTDVICVAQGAQLTVQGDPGVAAQEFMLAFGTTNPFDNGKYTALSGSTGTIKPRVAKGKIGHAASCSIFNATHEDMKTGKSYPLDPKVIVGGSNDVKHGHHKKHKDND